MLVPQMQSQTPKRSTKLKKGAQAGLLKNAIASQNLQLEFNSRFQA